jgi:hypothetical protein
MKPALGRVLGLFIFLAVAGLAVGWKFLHRLPPQSAGAQGEAVTLHGKIGGEKAGFADDPQIASALAKYRITLEARKAGSVEMVRESTAGVDFLWPASQVNVEDFHSAAGGTPAQAEEVFHSPLVFYSWDIITDVLMTNGIVQKQGEIYYLTGLAKLIALVEQRKKWADLGLSQFYSSILIHTTDPARSNSGNTWAALLASTYNDGEVLTADKLEVVLPKVKALFDRVGFMESSSGTLFDKFLKQGAGAYPIIVAYENQLLEFAAEHPELIEPVRRKLRILYPRPTIWASHPLIALNANGKRLIAALQDPQVQRLAWERHGFRSGLMGAIQVAHLPLAGVPATIDAVLPMPNLAVWARLTETLNTNPR